MSAATASWLMRITLTATVGESAPMPSMTVTVMTRPQDPAEHIVPWHAAELREAPRPVDKEGQDGQDRRSTLDEGVGLHRADSLAQAGVHDALNAHRGARKGAEYKA